MEEFFAQGDRELELGLPPSPGFNRSTTLIPQAQARRASNTTPAPLPYHSRVIRVQFP